MGDGLRVRDIGLLVMAAEQELIRRLRETDSFVTPLTADLQESVARAKRTLEAARNQRA